MRERRRGARGAVWGLLALLALAAPFPAAGLTPMPRPAPAVDPETAADLFAMPRIAAETRNALGLIERGDLDGAARILDRLLARHPGLASLHANRAALAMLAGDAQGALARLEAAAKAGMAGLDALAADPLFAPLRQDPALRPRLAALVAAAPDAEAPPAPAPARNGIAEISAANTVWNPGTERLEPRFALPGEPRARAVLPERPRTAAHDLLREHWRRGRAAGNHGDLYDNRDRGHSALEPGAHPQLTHTAYSQAARAADLDYGLNDSLLFGRPTIGNSSTAITTGAHWRSLPRLALTRPDGTGPMRLWQNARVNHLYIHPAHKDYGEEFGDLFPANTPYLLISRGSSGSDRPFLEAAAMILAAFKPETKAKAIAEGLIVPTVQMVFRRSMQNVRSREDYFSGAAHPAAFEGSNINLARMVSLAQSIEPGAIPAEVRLRVIEEELGREGADFFGAGLSEQLFDTPGAIARIWRARAFRRTMVVSAEASLDANDRPLAFHWRLLQGDPERVRIEPLAGGARARITLDWHDPFPVSDENPLETARVDIGVFAHNGAHDSAPAILSWYFPPHETRIYEPGPDGAMRIAAIDHADPNKADAYADPLLFPRAAWRDSYHYDATGAPAGWTRHRDGLATDYTPEGARILERGSAGARPRTEAVRYPLGRSPEGGLAVEELSADPGGGF